MDEHNDKLIVGDAEIAKLIGAYCSFCGSPRVVYIIDKPLSFVYPAGAYCYKCLSARAKSTRVIPFPIPQELLDSLKHDMGLPVNAAPIKFRM
jgi:hypothetical protein